MEFGLFEADLQSGELRKLGHRVRIQGQPFKVLAMLLERPNEVITREELQRRIWGEQTNVDFDHGLGTAVNKLRDALGDSAENPVFVETLARRGYRFIAPVRFEASPPAVLEQEKVADLQPEPEDLPGQALERFADQAEVETSAPNIDAMTSGAKPPAFLRVSLVLLILLLAFTVLALLPTRTEPALITQLTYSGRVLASMWDIESLSSTAVDGARIYFSQIADGNPVLAEALIANGELGTLSLPSGIQSPLIGSISPNGSQLVVRNHLPPLSEQPLWIVPTLGGNARRVADVLAHDATWMPDGLHILFSTGNELYTVKSDGSERRHFATVPGRAFWLRWNPKGTLLRFTILDSADRRASLWELSAGGTHLRPLLSGWTRPANECCGSWTADGKHFVFQSSHSGSANIWEMDEPVWWRTWLRTGIAAQPRMVTNGPLEFGAPATAPEGRRVFFVGANSRWEMLTFSAAGNQFVPLTASLASTSLVAYSPDGQWVAWLNAADGSLWRSRVDGSERLQLLSPPFHVFVMKWSPHNDRLAVMAQQPGSRWKLYLVDASGGGVQPVLDENRNQADPDWSADGQSIVYGRVPDAMGTDNQVKAIYLLDLATRKTTRLPGSEGLFSPRLSPDGRFLAAIRADQKALMLYDRDAGKWEQISSHSIADPVWTRDSRTLYFQDFAEAGKPIYRLSAAGDHREHRVAALENVRSSDVLDYRLIGLDPGDRPLVTAQTSVVNLYSTQLN